MRALALHRHYKGLNEKRTEVPYKALQGLWVFKWLLPVEAVRELNDWINQKAKMASDTAGASMSSGKPAMTNKGKKAPAAKSQVASLFKKMGSK